MYIHFRAEGQELRRIDSETVASDSKGFLRAKFEVDDEWMIEDDGEPKELALKAIFEQNGKRWSRVLDNGSCLVPVEVLNTGIFKVWLVGVDYDNVIRATTESVTVEVKRGPGYDAENSTDPTPEEKDEILSAANEAKRIASSVREDANSGKFNAKISSVTAESVPHGTPASVTNVGTGTDAKLVFKIPDGKEGKQGEPGPAGDSFYAFFTEEEIAKYIEEKNPETFKALWLGETNEAIEFGSVYNFTISDNQLIPELIGSLRGPEGATGKDGEVAAAFNNTNEINTYLTSYNVDYLSFIWVGTDNTKYNYTSSLGSSNSVALKKGIIYRFRVRDNSVIGFTTVGNLKGDNGVGIFKVERTSGDGSSGTTDTYTITLTDNTVGGTIDVYNGKDGYNAHLKGKPVYGIYNADDIAGLVNVLEGSETVVIARNLGETFTTKTSDNAAVTIYKHSIYSIQFIAGTVQGITLVERENVEGMLVQFEDTVAGYFREVLLLNGLNAPQGGGAGGSGSGEYELIKRITITKENVTAGFSINSDEEGNPFELKAITCFCYFAEGETGNFDILLKTDKNTAFTSVYKRSSIINTAPRYYKVHLELEGYWTGSANLSTDGKGANDEYGIWAKGKVQGKANGIRVGTDSSGVVIPDGSVIEIFGVRA